MKNTDDNQTKVKINNLQNAIVQRAIIRNAYILNDAKSYVDLIYNYCFNNNSEEDVKEWFKIKDVILLSNLHYIRNLRDAYISDNDTANIDYEKILNILNEYQKYMRKIIVGYDLPYFDFENEIKIKKAFQLNCEVNNDAKEDTNIYYHSCYTSNGKLLKLERKYSKVEDSNLSVYAVIHNLLIRTKLIPKTDYLLQANLNEQELNYVYYFEIIILNAIKNGDFGYHFLDSLDILARRTVELAGYSLKKK